MEENDFCYSLFPSPVGTIRLISFRGKLTHLLFQKTEKTRITTVLTQIKAKSQSFPIKVAQPLRDEDQFKHWHNLLNRYFCGERVSFDEPICLTSGTILQKKIWSEITRIPHGVVRSYQDVSNRLGMKKSARVVGGACGMNPIPIIIPCHRVVQKNGSLGGFRCGIEIKKSLLAVEGYLHA